MLNPNTQGVHTITRKSTELFLILRVRKQAKYLAFIISGNLFYQKAEEHENKYAHSNNQLNISYSVPYWLD